MAAEKPVPKRIARVIRELVAIAVWMFAILKVFVIDLDIYLVSRLAPSLLWLLDFRVFGILGALTLLWLGLGNKRFFRNVAFVVGYPFIVLFWRLPKLCFSRWPLVVAFVPAVYGAIRAFKATFIFYSVGSISALVILLSQNRVAVSIAMAGLGALLLSHYWRSMTRAYRDRPFAGLTRLARTLREEVADGAFPVSPVVSETPASKEKIQEQINQELTSFLILNRGAEFVAEKVSEVAQSRKHDFYLIGSLLFTVLLTVVVFAFEYLGLSCVSADAFAGAVRPGFWEFLGLSFGVLMTSDLSPITPANTSARLLAHGELACALLLLVFFVFLVLTAHREIAKEEITAFADELKGVGAALELRLRELHNLSLAELEVTLVASNASVVNLLRRMRGAPELSGGAEEFLRAEAAPALHDKAQEDDT